ncbi:hypothetical protein BESB_053980 [Besnoitia besnoiti]|uniref:Phosphoglycerate mutase family protein n=1 Tax=Besnoitia besnoiti TaxID=94643 RepID=A0A2A9MJH1_BESBE|nr:hypothetical protein BESB_053980 [Besnoitia besnoiti]PFH35747.1 hypothetical protein BESB_053980 [Besnoitia besnoiti]
MAEVSAPFASHSASETGYRPVHFYFLRHAEGSHNRAVKERKPGQSRKSVFASAAHFDARLSCVGRAQCTAAASAMPAPLRLALKESLGFGVEDAAAEPDAARRVSEAQAKQALTESPTAREDEPQSPNVSAAKQADAAGQPAAGGAQTHAATSSSVVLCTSTLRRSLETGHLVLQGAVKGLKAEENGCARGGTSPESGDGLPQAVANAGDAEDCLALQTVRTFALEDLRECSGGGHICDGRSSTQELRKFCEPRFADVSFVVPQEDDPLPPSMPRESRADVERRCVSFLRFVFSLARSADSASSCTERNRGATRPLEPFAPAASTPLHVFCIVHSAWTRHFFSLLGMFDPPARGLRNCEWRSFTTSAKSLERALEKLSQPSSGLAASLAGASASSEFPLLLPASPLAGAGSSDASHRALQSVDAFTRCVPRDFFSLLIFPPTALQRSTSAAASAAREDSATAEDASQAAVERILDWARKYRYMPSRQSRSCAPRSGDTEGDLTSHTGERPGLSACRGEAHPAVFEALAPEFEEKAAAMRILETEEGERREVVTDATWCLSAVKEERENGKWELIAKERVHRQTCVLVVLPLECGSSDPEGATAVDAREEEISQISSYLLPHTAGSSDVYRLDILSL